jgi:hypothetical protein
MQALSKGSQKIPESRFLVRCKMVECFLETTTKKKKKGKKRGNEKKPSNKKICKIYQTKSIGQSNIMILFFLKQKSRLDAVTKRKYDKFDIRTCRTCKSRCPCSSIIDSAVYSLCFKLIQKFMCFSNLLAAYSVSIFCRHDTTY